jgi:restriction system protein
MAVPTFDQLLKPILELANREDVTRSLATKAMIGVFSLSEEEQQETIKTGPTKISNRTGWAMSHLTKAGLIHKIAKAAYRATDKGVSYLKQHKGPITVADLREIEGWKEAWDAGSKKREDGKKVPVAIIQDTTPEEQIDRAIANLDEALNDELLEHLRTVDPFRFEQIVIDLLFSMGYGGSREEAAKVTKKSGDEGIDGIINEDRLGLDVIYVQAKRWQNTVGRKEIQSFVGALAGKQANKGVFITTSDFASTATEYAQMVTQKVILIDGLRLADLMIEHNIGISITRTISLKRIDSDYFEES